MKGCGGGGLKGVSTWASGRWAGNLPGYYYTGIEPQVDRYGETRSWREATLFFNYLINIRKKAIISSTSNIFSPWCITKH